MSADQLHRLGFAGNRDFVPVSFAGPVRTTDADEEHTAPANNRDLPITVTKHSNGREP